MARRSSFFSWWFGELREVFSGKPIPVHALILSDHEIALVEKGVETPLGVVDLDAEDWREQIEGLRTRLVTRRNRNPAVELQLPPDQVMFARIAAAEDGTDRRSAVAARIPELTGEPLEDVVFDVSRRPEADGQFVVAVSPATTVKEAGRYAAAWGFDPVRITSMETPGAFPRGPEFVHRNAPNAGSPLPKIALALAVLAICIGIGAAWRAASHRAALAQEATLNAAAIGDFEPDLERDELRLVQFAHAAATASDLRESRMPVWRILAEVASIVPDDVVLSHFDYRSGQIVLRGSTSSTVALEEALDRSPIFTAPTLSGTSRSVAGRAKFTMEATVDERNMR